MNCDHLNPDSSFKGGFHGAVAHLRECGGFTERTAWRICSWLGFVEADPPKDWVGSLVARAHAADGDGDNDQALQQHVRGCAQCKTGILCQKGKTMLMATMEPANTASARASFAGADPIVAEASSGDTFDIQWMPPGQQDITCFVNDEQADLAFPVRPQHAPVLNSSLQRLRSLAAAGQGDMPFIDFNHEDGAAAGHPTELYWAGDDPKGGIRLKGKWTGSGKSAVVNRDFTRFSPQWEFDPDSKEPIGVKVNLGGLVNRAAFRQIQTVVAKHAARTGKEHTMDRTEFQQLLTEGLKPITERLTTLEAKAGASSGSGAAATAQAAQAGDDKIIKLIELAVKPITDKLSGFEQSQQASATAAAKSALQVHINRGAIAPEDTETISFYATAYAKDAAGTEKVMAKLPGKSLGRIAGAGGTATATAATEPQYVFMAKAKEFAKANKIEGGDAEIMNAFARTAEGRELYTEFRKQIHHK